MRLREDLPASAHDEDRCFGLVAVQFSSLQLSTLVQGWKAALYLALTAEPSSAQQRVATFVFTAVHDGTNAADERFRPRPGAVIRWPSAQFPRVDVHTRSAS